MVHTRCTTHTCTHSRANLSSFSFAAFAICHALSVCSSYVAGSIYNKCILAYTFRIFQSPRSREKENQIEENAGLFFFFFLLSTSCRYLRFAIASFSRRSSVLYLAWKKTVDLQWVNFKGLPQEGEKKKKRSFYGEKEGTHVERRKRIVTDNEKHCNSHILTEQKKLWNIADY